MGPAEVDRMGWDIKEGVFKKDETKCSVVVGLGKNQNVGVDS